MVIEQLAWAAGFFDGEGATYLCKTRYTVHLSVKQVSQATLLRFQSAVLGLGTVVGPMVKNTKWQPIYEFRTYSFEHTQAVLGFIWKWLTPIKREQALKCLKAYRKHLFEHPGLRRKMLICRKGHDCSIKDGLYITTNARRCRQCTEIYISEYRAKHREEAIRYAREYRNKNRDLLRLKDKIRKNQSRPY